MRRFVSLAALMGSLFTLCYPDSPVVAGDTPTVRDTMWVWAHYEGSYNNQWGLPGKSTMTPVAGAKWLGVPNIIMLRYGANPKPPLDQYAESFRTTKRVMWSVTGDGGTTSESERDHVFSLAAKMPNITGVFMDDFFRFQLGYVPKSPTEETPASLSTKELEQLRKRLDINGRKLDLGVVVYTHQLDKQIIPHLKYCDIVSLWTWDPADLAHLEDNFAKLQALAPGKRILLGLYMWDFAGKGKPMPIPLMKKQCELALKWLREGRIEGMIFLAAGLCDLNLEAVNWTRSWIAEVGDQPLHAQ